MMMLQLSTGTLRDPPTYRSDAPTYISNSYLFIGGSYLLIHHITHKLRLLSTYVGSTLKCLRGIDLPGWSLQTRLHPHPDLSHTLIRWRKSKKQKKTCMSE